MTPALFQKMPQIGAAFWTSAVPWPPTLHHKCAPTVWQIQSYTKILRAEVLGNLPSSSPLTGWPSVWTLSSLVRKTETCTKTVNFQGC